MYIYKKYIYIYKWKEFRYYLQQIANNVLLIIKCILIHSEHILKSWISSSFFLYEKI